MLSYDYQSYKFGYRKGEDMKKKLLGTLVIMTVLLGGISQAYAAVTDNDITFRFNIKSYQGNSFS